MSPVNRRIFCLPPIPVLLLLSFVLFANSRDPLPRGIIKGTGHTLGFGELEEEWRGEIIHLSWSPRAFLLKGFLSDEECDFLVKESKDRLSKSTVVDDKTGGSTTTAGRTSEGSYFPRGANDIVKRIENRVAQVSMLPVENQEAMQTLKYENGQRYNPHNDFFSSSDPENMKEGTGGQRAATLLMYLSTVEEGGETVFPGGDKKVTGDEWSECAKAGLAVKPYKGDALFFYNLKPDGNPDPASLHGSCATTKGVKWSATKWIRTGTRRG